MTEFRIDENLFAQADHGTVLADGRALAAMDTLGFVELRHECPDRLAIVDRGLEKNMAVGLFDIAVDISYGPTMVGGHVR